MCKLPRAGSHFDASRFLHVKATGGNYARQEKSPNVLTAGVTSRRHEVETNHEFDISLMPADTAAQSETAADREPTDTASVSCS